MTSDQVRCLLDLYRKELLKHGATRPIRDSKLPDLNHLLWMCDEIESLLNTPLTTGAIIVPPVGIVAVGSKERNWLKVMRWLGFLQGAMCWAKIRSIDEMRADNRGDG